MYRLFVWAVGLFLTEFILDYASAVMCVFMLLFRLLTAASLVK